MKWEEKLEKLEKMASSCMAAATRVYGRHTTLTLAERLEQTITLATALFDALVSDTPIAGERGQEKYKVYIQSSDCRLVEVSPVGARECGLEKATGFRDCIYYDTCEGLCRFQPCRSDGQGTYPDGEEGEEGETHTCRDCGETFRVVSVFQEGPRAKEIAEAGLCRICADLRLTGKLCDVWPTERRCKFGSNYTDCEFFGAQRSPKRRGRCNLKIQGDLQDDGT